MKEFESKWNGVFPEWWGIVAHLINEFCGFTRVAITRIFEKNPNQDLTIMLRCLSQTMSQEQKFIKDMEKRYGEYLGGEEPEPQSQLQEQKQTQKLAWLPKFSGSMSEVYSNYLRPYVEKEDREMRDNFLKYLKEDTIDVNADFKVLGSSLMMFSYIKSLIKRAGQYSRSKIMVEIYKTIQGGLHLYVDELLKLIQREETSQKRTEQTYLNCVSFVINTAEYCKDTIQGLEDLLK